MSDWKAEALVEFICDDVGAELFKMTCCDLTHCTGTNWRLMDGFYWYFNNKGLSGASAALAIHPSPQFFGIEDEQSQIMGGSSVLQVFVFPS